MTQPRLLGGRYELDGVVGRGGMAEVYRARDIRLDRIVAVKTLREDLARDQTFQARFRREAQSAASLNHPSIVAVYDTGEDAEGPAHVPYIVMEYVDGRTLRELLRDDRRLLPERALEITDGVLRALDYSHRNGIVHRDIKPGNVMLTRSAEVKVMDFGIARAVSDAQATMTQTAQVIGTAQYLSPEQARGERVDARSDLYSTGCLLYELLTGRPPFTGDSPVAIAYQHVRENPIPPSRIDPEIPAWADSIVLKAMAKDPADRYQSAAEMRTDIQRALSGVPVAAPPPTEMYAPGTQRMGPATMMAGAGPTSTVAQYGAGDDGYGSGRRSRRALWWVIGAIAAVLVILIAFLALHGNGGKTVGVPSVVGQSQQQAVAALQRAGLKANVVKVSSATVKAGTVISSNPQFGSKVAVGSSVTLDVSAGPKKHKMPDVVGEQATAAQNQLQNLGFNVSEKTDATLTVKAGQVIRQSPAPNTLLGPGANVTIYVSGGGTNVPSVIGDPQATAQTVLQNSGFKVSVVTAAGPAGTAAGTVFNQNPGANQTAPQGTTVTIFVAAQTQPTTPPPSSPAASASPTPTVSATTPPPTATPTP